MMKEIFNKMNNKNNNTTVILWGVPVSPYVRKVMAALAEKDIAYEQKEVLPKTMLEATGQPVPLELCKVSPLGKIPAIQVDNFSLADSAAIAGYLDRKFSTGNPLYPSHPEEYGQALWFEHYSDTVLTSVLYQKIFVENVVKPHVLKQKTNNAVVDHALSKELPPLLNYLDQSIQNKKWFSGDHFSMADVAITTQILAIKMAGYEFPDNLYINLQNHQKKTLNRPSFNKIRS